MRVTVGKHMEKLRKRLEELNAAAMNDKLSRLQRNRIEVEIRWVNVALSHFEKALKAEKKVSRSVRQ